MKINEHLRKYMKINENLRKLMKIKENLFTFSCKAHHFGNFFAQVVIWQFFHAKVIILVPFSCKSRHFGGFVGLVRPHKLQIQIFPTFFQIPGSPEHSNRTNNTAGRSVWEGVGGVSTPLWEIGLEVLGGLESLELRTASTRFEAQGLGGYVSVHFGVCLGI